MLFFGWSISSNGNRAVKGDEVITETTFERLICAINKHDGRSGMNIFGNRTLRPGNAKNGS